MATIVNMHEAKSQLSQLVARVQAGEEITLAKAGKPAARIVPMEDAQVLKPKRRLGFLRDAAFRVPDDFNQMGQSEIEQMFYGDSGKHSPKKSKLAKQPKGKHKR